MESKVIERFQCGIDCSQVVLETFAEELGIDADTARKMGACFGGGVCGETCGAVVGALIVIGLKYGHFEDNNAQQKGLMVSKRGEFLDAFGKEWPSIVCKELLGYNLSVPEELQKVLDENLMFTRCPKIVETAIRVLKEV